MYKNYYTFLFFVVLIFIWGSSTAVLGQDAYDIAPNTTVQADTAPSANFTYPKLFGWHYSTIAPQNGGTVGAMFFDGQYYLNAWNSANLFLYDGGLSGPQNLLNTLTYQGSIRDMATDGTWLYGSAANTTIHRMDANGISQGTITSAGGNARAIAYSEDEDAFFVCDFSNNIGVINAQTGALIRTLTGTSTLASKYGMAYTTAAQLAGGPYLWVWGQGSLADPFNKLWKLDPANGNVIDTYQFGPLPVTTSVAGIAGGASIVQIADRWVLLLNYQNFEVQGYDLGVVVPVELSSFTASVVKENVSLNWSTASEINNHGFEVERAVSGSEFVTIGFVEGYGTTTETKNYNFVDKNVVSGKYTYRLKQVDFDGRFEYSHEVEVDFESAPVSFSLNQNFPNPFNPSTRISFSLPVESDVTLKVFNVIGEEMKNIVKGTYSAGIHNFEFDASGLNSGVYFYSLEAHGTDGTNFTEVKKMILTK